MKGDLLDMTSMRTALTGVDRLFLLNAVSADELTKALLTLNLAAEAEVRHVVYFSMLNADVFLDCPHSSAKFATEQMIHRFGIPATILRPTYFFQNDAMNKKPLLDHGVYPMPIGAAGASMVDARDIAEVAALALLGREAPGGTIEIVGPETFTGTSIAALWSEVAGRPVAYGGDDLAAFEKQMGAQSPGWMAYDTAMMFRGFQRDGMLGKPGAADSLSRMLGRSLRTYRNFARETMQQWREAV